MELKGEMEVPHRDLRTVIVVATAEISTEIENLDLLVDTLLEINRVYPILGETVVEVLTGSIGETRLQLTRTEMRNLVIGASLINTISH